MRAAVTGVVVVGLNGAAARATPPCVDPGAGFAVPATGAVGVPRNATPFVSAGVVRFLDSDGADVAATIDTVTPIGTSSDAVAHRVRSDDEHVAGATYRVEVGGRERTSFVVGDACDDVAPAAPSVGLPRRYDNCGASSVALGEQAELGAELERTGAAIFVVSRGRRALGRRYTRLVAPVQPHQGTTGGAAEPQFESK